MPAEPAIQRGRPASPPDTDPPFPQVDPAQLTTGFQSALPDADLVQLERLGLEAARQALLRRYIGASIRHAERACSEAASQLLGKAETASRHTGSAGVLAGQTGSAGVAAGAHRTTASQLRANDHCPTTGPQADQQPRNRWLRLWGVPANWSRRDWLEEMSQVQAEAALEVLHEFDPAGGLSFQVVLRRRVTASLRSRLRQETAFARRTTPIGSVSGADTDEPAAPSEDPAIAGLREAVAGLPEPQQHLIFQTFWKGLTQAELGRDLHLNQRQVSRRTVAALLSLRGLLGSPPQVRQPTAPPAALARSHSH